jgi:hypothetical protein
MMRLTGKRLVGLLRLLSVAIGFFVFLSLSPVLRSPSAFANDSTQQCSVPVQACGCNTCGGGGYGRPSCPAGQSLYDDYCVPDCPIGYIRYPGLPGLCLPPVQFGCPEGFDQVPLPYCPLGYLRDLRDPGRCIPDYDQLRNSTACPDGMSYSGETGRCEFICLEGMYRDTVGLCQSYYGRQCPQGYGRDAETGQCLPPGIWAPNYRWICLATCPVGTYRDLQHPTRCIPPPPTCIDGFEDQNGRCLPICDKGAVRDNYGYCVPPTCPDGKYPNIRGTCVVTDCPDDQVRNGNGVCEPPQRGCDRGFETFRGQCVKLCDQGTARDDNGRCVPPPPNTPRCSNNMTYSSVLKRCAPNRPPEVNCKRNEFKDKNGRCRPVQQQQPDCPRGYRMDSNGDCTKIITFVPRGCPDGTFYSKRSRSCVPIDNQEPDPYVPDDGGNNPRLPPPMIFNPGVLKQLLPRGGNDNGINVQQSCPDGMYRDNNGRCVGKQ